MRLPSAWVSLATRGPCARAVKPLRRWIPMRRVRTVCRRIHGAIRLDNARTSADTDTTRGLECSVDSKRSCTSTAATTYISSPLFLSGVYVQHGDRLTEGSPHAGDPAATHVASLPAAAHGACTGTERILKRILLRVGRSL